MSKAREEAKRLIINTKRSLTISTALKCLTGLIDLADSLERQNRELDKILKDADDWLKDHIKNSRY